MSNPKLVGLAISDEDLDFEKSTLPVLSGQIEDLELSAAISCEPDTSNSGIQKRKGLPEVPEQCFDNSGGICPYQRPNLVCCDEPVMYRTVLVRGCVICRFYVIWELPLNLNEMSDKIMRLDSSMEFWVFWALSVLLSCLQCEGTSLFNFIGNV